MSISRSKLSPNFFLLIGIILLGFLSENYPATLQAQALEKEGTAKGPMGGIVGDPSRKRGVEMGYDMGFQMGKSDQRLGLEPDPKRHDTFNDPNQFYRYEFGSRAGFVSGFRGGFVGGYQKAYGKKVKVAAPTTPLQSPSPGTTQGSAPAPKASRTSAKPAPPPQAPDTSSDAL